MLVKQYPPVVILKKSLVWAGIVFILSIVFLILYNLYQSSAKPIIHSLQSHAIQIVSDAGDVDWYQQNKKMIATPSIKYHQDETQKVMAVERTVPIPYSKINSKKTKQYSQEELAAMRVPITSNQLIGEDNVPSPSSMLTKSMLPLLPKKYRTKSMTHVKRSNLYAAMEQEHQHSISSTIADGKILQAGTLIPSILVSGLNADLPGQVIAQVRSNVYDSLTGNDLLIPQGAKIIGWYRSQTVYGQRRLLVFWKHIILPNGKHVYLNEMPGIELNGYTGFYDKVNNHYWKIFGSIALVSLFNSGMQTAYLSSSQNSLALSPHVTRDLLTTGSMLTKKNLAIQPTLEIRPGYLFNIMVTEKIQLKPYGEKL